MAWERLIVMMIDIMLMNWSIQDKENTKQKKNYKNVCGNWPMVFSWNVPSCVLKISAR